MDVRFSVVGLGKLGASMAAAIASRGFYVIGVDVNHRAVELVNAGHAPVQETNLEETIAANRERLRATLSHREAILNSDVTFVVVPTPSDDRGAFSLQYAAWAFREIGRALKEKDGYHNVVLTSTVLPGSTRYGLLPILERESGKVCGREKAPAAICRKIAVAKLTGNPEVEIWGDGEQTRSFCYIDDCIKGIHLPMRSDYHEPLNLGQDRMVTINQLADMIAEIAGVKIVKKHVPGPQGVRGRNSDNTRLRQVPGWEPEISLEDGLARTYAWIEEQVRAKLAAASDERSLAAMLAHSRVVSKVTA